ncbi:VOC family protein [Pediococcus siamensis]|uniref:VOC family protein n=1 Tax=Pediococcus siamensis TaxID=381829 RepID=UPI00399F3EB8
MANTQKGQINRNFIIQIGILVKNIEETAKNWAEFLAVPVPEVHLNNPYEVTQATYHGEPCPARINQVNFDFNNLQIELISPADDQASFWRECLERDGEGVHHLALAVRDSNGVAHQMADLNMPSVQKGEFQNGRYTYFDSFDKLKVYLEALELDTTPGTEFEKKNPLAK